MVVSMLHMIIYLPGISSLKEKRKIIVSLKDRIWNKYKLSIAEVGSNDIWHTCELGCAIVSNSQSFGETVLHKVINFSEENLSLTIQKIRIFSEHY